MPAILKAHPVGLVFRYAPNQPQMRALNLKNKVFMMIRSLFLTLLFVPVITQAGGTSGWGKIEQLYINANSNVLRLTFSQPIENPDGCTAETWYMREISEQNQYFVSSVLAAFYSNKDVRFWISGCTSVEFWGGTQPQINDIEVK